MNVVFIQGTSLSARRAHWVQILNTAWAFANRGNTRVHVLARAFAPGDEERTLSEMGLAPLATLHFTPVWSASVTRMLRPTGDPFTRRQGAMTRALALRTLRRTLADLPAGPTLVYTRDQEVPLIAASALDRPETVVVNEHHKFEYVKRLEGKLARKRPGRRTLGQFKEWARREKTLEMERLSRFAGVVCTTPSIRERLLAFGYDQPTTWIPNGARLNKSDDADGGVEKDIEILYVGQLLRWKNVDEVIKALVHLPGRQLTVVGGEPGSDMDRLKDLAAEVGVTERVHFLGHRPHGEIHGFMRRARVGVVPLPRRGFPEARLYCNPLKALEMMAAGTPIVATRLRSVEGLLEHGANAWMVDPDDPVSLAEGIRAVLESETLQSDLSRGGRDVVSSLSYDARVDRILAFASECGLPDCG